MGDVEQPDGHWIREFWWLIVACGAAMLVLSTWLAHDQQDVWHALLDVGPPLGLGLLAAGAWRQQALQKLRNERDVAVQHAKAHEALVCRMRRQDRRCPVECEDAHTLSELRSELQLLHDQKVHLEEVAQHDALTGLANRLLLADRFASAVQRSLRSGDAFGLLMLDLNGFKRINDEHGHAMGDKVLIQIAHRLTAAVRGSDTVARVGGDEFVLLLEGVGSREELQVTGRKISDWMARPMILDNHTLALGASIGEAAFPEDGANLEDLMHVADKAMYACKTSSQFGALR